MKPRLYEESETTFTSNGLGVLSDAMSCVVTEERNGPYELEMTYPITGIHFDELRHSRIIWAIPADGKGPQPFRIYYISKPLNGEVEVKADHISYQLSHIPVSPFTATTVGGALTGMQTYSAETNPFTFWTDKTTVANFEVTIPTSIRALLGGQEGSILDVYGGGEYEFDKYTVKLYQNRGADNDVTLRYGKNITDIQQEENIANTYTGVFPYWVGAPEGSEGEVLITLPEKVLHASSAQNFPYQRTVPLDLSSEFQEQPTQAQLRTRAQAYMDANNIGIPSVSIEVNFVALWQTEEHKTMANLERVNLCDIVTVEFPLLGVSANAKVIKTEYDVLKERYNSVDVGDVRSKLTTELTRNTNDSIAQASKKLASKTFMEQSIERATELITGGLGGYVIIGRNANGEPNEILIMDTDDIQTAVNVIRINQNGIGFSHTGYEGPFISAWTIDGHFVADFIDTGSLSASLVTAGTMSADRINGGTLVLGGSGNTNGVLQVKDASGNVICTLNNTGANVIGDIVMEKLNSRCELATIEYYYNNWVTGDLLKATGNGLRVKSLISGSNSEFSEVAMENTVVQSTLANTSARRIVGIVGSGEKKSWGYDGELGSLEETVSLDGYDLEFWRYYSGSGGWEGHLRFSQSKLMIAESRSASSTSSTYDKAIVVDSGGILLSSDNHYLQVTDNYRRIDGYTISVTGSSRRYKHDIRPLTNEGLDPHKLLDLPVVEFIYNEDYTLGQHHDTIGMLLPGFIAEDVEEIYPSAVIHQPDTGLVETWDEKRIIPGMLALIQEQDEKIKKLEAEMLELRAMIMELREG